MKYGSLLVSAILPFSASVQAKDALSLGAGVAIPTSAYADYDDDNIVMPIVKFENQYFFIDSDGAGYKLFEHAQHRIGLVVGIGKDKWNASKTERFRALDDRHRSTDFGVSYRFQDRSYGQLNARAVTDLRDHHSGVLLALGYGYPYAINSELMLIPSLNLSYMDADYANYYYGISDSEAARTRFDAYDTGAAIKYGVGLAANYKLTAEWSVTGGASINWLERDLQDSPLVNDDKERMLFIGASYKFW